jgi:predicted acyltransferase
MTGTPPAPARTAIPELTCPEREELESPGPSRSRGLNSDSNKTRLPENRFKRLLSLDVLRGLTIAFMIMVNNNGGRGSWVQMNHADWNGLTATDLVFPTFLFVVGVSIVLSFQARLARGATRRQLALHTLIRAGILFLFGVVVNSYPYFEIEHLRFYGVLQRIAICYLVVGLFYLWDRRVSTKVQALVFVLVYYWILVRWIPVPGAGMPGRDVLFLDKDQNIVAWVDRQLMPGHLYEERDTHNARDPEGLLSTIPTLGTALLGLLTGMWLRSERSTKTRVLGMAAGALGCLALGYLWSIEFPLNKKMWTSSYVLVAAGWALVVFALAYWVCEVKGLCREGWSKGLAWPWLIFGSNAIVAYMVSELLGETQAMILFTYRGHDTTPFGYVREQIFRAVSDPGWAAFGYSVFYTALCFIPVWILFRKKIFLKV